MRLRVQTFPPLPDLRAWFIPDACQVPSSILDLKNVLCSQMTALAGVRQADIRLLLDEFELLNESPYAAALRDGDLVCIEALPGFKHLDTLKVEKKEEADTSSRLSKKRKRTDGMKKPKKKSRLKVKKVEEPDSDDESESSSSSSSPSSSSSSPSARSSSSSSSASSSSSGSEKSDSSESESESTTSPPSAPPVKSSKPPAQKSKQIATVAAPNQLPLGPFVPPGQGKSTTHARNLRRKRLRAVQTEARTAATLEQTQAAQALPSLPRGVSQTNATPLGHRAVSQQPVPVDNGEVKERGVGAGVDPDADMQSVVAEAEPEERREVMMASLGNKNKKKGYKQFLMAPVPKKIVFADGEGESVYASEMALTSSSTPMGPTAPQALTSEAPIETSARIQLSSSQQRPLPRLVPPSEIQERGKLPPNMFVTSVDVEAGLWNSNGKKRKNKQKQAGASYEHHHLFDDSYNKDNGYQADEDVTLTYGNDEQVGEAKNDAQSDIPPEPVVETAIVFDWNKAEDSFDKSPKFIQLADLKQASIVGWKSLDLNPQTFTPEILLVAAKVLEISHPASTVKVQRLLRPTNPNSGFSGFLVPADPDGAEVEGDTEEYQWTDILTSDWRLLQVA